MGGMGEIFLARLDGAEGFEKLYVIKRILPHLADDRRFRAMLVSEARIAANMSHPNICHVYELDESNRQLFIVMEYLEGVTLLALLRRHARENRQLELGFIAGVVQQVTAGLDYAHELTNRDGQLLGIVHRDVTPSNIFLTESGLVKIHDFGVAKVKDATTTESGTVKGKFGYMAPEQIQGGEIDRRVDVFAFGVVIAEMVTNRRLFQRKTDYLTFRAVMEQPLPEFRKHRPDVPEALVAVLVRALARDPDDRFATVRELGAAAVDAMVIAKPWSQTQIAELVRREFAGEIRDHHAEISTVVRTSRSSMRSIPVILQSPSDADEADYLAIETTDVEDEPLEAARERAASEMPSLPRAPHAPRGWWPTVTVIGAAALLLVIGMFVVGRNRGDQTVAATCTVESDGKSGAYADAIHTSDARIAACAAEHRDEPAQVTTALIRIGPDGHTTQVSLEPATVTGSPFAACLRDVLGTVSFPRAESETEIKIALRR
jgi:eukaryotic-like serine/threonine-protein kinase